MIIIGITAENLLKYGRLELNELPARGMSQRFGFELPYRPRRFCRQADDIPHIGYGHPKVQLGRRRHVVTCSPAGSVEKKRPIN